MEKLTEIKMEADMETGFMSGFLKVWTGDLPDRGSGLAR